MRIAGALFVDNPLYPLYNFLQENREVSVNYFMKIGWIIFWVILACLFWMAFWGFLTNAILRRRGYKENWFWKGFFMPGFAAAKAMSMPEADQTESVSTPLQPVTPLQPAPQQQAYSDAPLFYDWGVADKTEPFMPAVQNLEATRKLYAGPASAEPAQILSNDSWRCVCGRVNYAYIGTCACGRNKSGRNAEEEAMEKKQREKAEAEKKRLEQQKKLEQEKLEQEKAAKEKAAREAALKAEEERKAQEAKKAREAKPQQQDISAMDEQAKLRMIREMKALLDEGIITQQEFDRKKKEYLGF